MTLLMANVQNANAQYCGAATTNITILPDITVQTTASYSSGFRAFNFAATSGCSYTFSTCGLSSADTYLRLYSTSTGGTLLVSADDQCGVQSSFTWTCPTTGTYSVLLSNYSCSPLSSATSMNYSSSCSASACTNPTNGGIAISTPSAACPGQNIALSLTGAAQGSGLTYQWQSSPAGVTYTNIAGATSSSYSVVQSSSTYYRCVVTCASGTPVNSTPVQVNMNSFVNCYCTSNATSASYGDISGVTLGSMTTVSGCGITGGPGSITGQYSDYTNTTPATAIPNLTQGFTYPMSVNVISCIGNYNYSTKIWIDYNQNGLFTDPGEEIFTPSSATVTPFTINNTFVVPTNATVGTTRMRIVTVETSSVASVSPCGTYLWGETEDYFVNIAVPLAEDAGIVNFVNPVVPTCTFNDSVSVTLKNYGTDTLTSVNINWSKNAINLTPLFWTGNLAPLADTTVFVGTTVYVAGDDLCAWTTNPNGVIENPAGSYNDSSCIFGLLTGLSGLYTIGGTTPDFTDFPSAIAALNFAGVCGPTVFDVRTGTYFDQFDLGQVIGTNATNTVTFKSEAGHRDSVIIDYGAAGSTNNYVVQLNGADYFRFESMTIRNSGATYGRVFDILGGSDHNVVYDCEINTQANSSTSTFICPIYGGSGSNDDFNRFEGNSIIGGSYGAYIYGASTSSRQEGNEFINNEFVDNYYMGLRLYYTKNVTVTGNRVYGQSTYNFRYGIYAYYTDGASVFSHNSVESNASSFFYYGMYIFYADGASNARGLIANNSVTVGNATTTGTYYGLYFYQSGFYDIYNNSVSVVNGGTSGRAFYLYNGGANNVKNNSWTNFGTGYASYIFGTYSVNEMDYNNYYTNGSQIGYYGNANTATFAAWQAASGHDANGINVNPGYYSDYDLHVCSDSLNEKGTPLASITDDRDMQARNASTPDIGSDEFSPLGQPGFLGPDALVCTGQTVCISAGAPADQILWSTGDTTNTICLTPGTYTVTVIGSCATAFDTIVVTASALSYNNFLAADTMTFCTGGSVLLTSTMPATTYSWTGGSTNDSLVVTAGGTYTLNITDACGTGSESVVITENSTPVASFTAVSVFLTGDFTNTSTGGGATTYLWNFGDGSTSTQMSPIHVYSTVGTFTVTLTVTNACGTNTTTQTVTSSNLGLEEVEGVGTISVYPNPTTGAFQIDFNTINDVNIAVQVTNVLGQSVYAKNIGSINGTHKDAIDITAQAPGVYYVTIVSDNKTVMTNKLIKQ
jgi:PKD repeat protein